MGARELQRQAPRQRQIGLRHQHRAGRHVDRLADAGGAVGVARGRAEFDQVGAERGRSEQQRCRVAERALDARLDDPAARAQGATEDHAVLGGLVDLVEAEALLQAGRDLQGLGHSQVDGHRLDPAEGRGHQRARGDLGDRRGDGHAETGAELDDEVGRRDGRAGGQSRGEERQRDPARDHGGVDADLRPELVDGVVDRVGELVERRGHLAPGVGQVLQPTAVLALGALRVAAPELVERLDRLTRVVVDDRRRALLHRAPYVVHGVREGAPGRRRRPQLPGVGLRPPQAQMEQDLPGLVLNAHRHRPSSGPSPR
ncbi:hypothetical protein ABZT44_00110 [Streptomyces mirabilis]